MTYKRLLTIQDISCVGQCSLTVALPILSACGHETCVLPSAVLSTHTAGFCGYTCKDLTDEMPAIVEHWKKENLSFDALYTGYLGSTQQIDIVKHIIATRLTEGALRIIDPAMADNGKLYPAFDMEYVQQMKTLCSLADIILPNITEACLLADLPYPQKVDEEFVSTLLTKLSQLGCKTIVLTGVGYDSDSTGVVVWEDGKIQYYRHRLIPRGCHGTGDVYASAFVGALLAGKSCYDAAKLAADYTVECIEVTQQDASHWYGVRFELCLKSLVNAL